jgi:hypothetical protein
MCVVGKAIVIIVALIPSLTMINLDVLIDRWRRKDGQVHKEH